MHLYALVMFFQPGRDKHGTYFSLSENLLNAFDRRLSTYSEEELLQLRDGTKRFMQLIENERSSREDD